MIAANPAHSAGTRTPRASSHARSNWIPVISEKMQSGSIFFAVGAGHLAGENGVLDLLQKIGEDLSWKPNLLRSLWND